MSLFGQQHNERARQLITWWRQGPPVGFLEGFPGVGKSNAILPEVRQRVADQGATVATIEAPDPGRSQLDDLLLDLTQELSLVGVDALVRAIDEGRGQQALLMGLQQSLRQPLLIVIDEAQNLLDLKTGEPISAIRSLLDRVARHVDWPGRLLLVTNRMPRKGRWSDPHAFFTLKPFDPDDGVAFLGHLLAASGREAEIPADRREDVVAWVGGNPRALKLIVAALASAELDDLIGIEPELWELRDREVSRSLLENLERELLRKVVEQLAPEVKDALLLASVYRKPVKREAWDAMPAGRGAGESARRELVDRFLLEHHRGWFLLNPVAREVARAELNNDTELRRRAHSLAGEHYARHFRAREITGGGRLAGHFVEARYHLVLGERENELSGIASRFLSHLQAEITAVAPVPSERRELGERIAVLAGALQGGGPKTLEYHLARCLERRGRGDDRKHALAHARRAVGAKAPAAAWHLLIRLEGDLTGTKAAVKVLRQAEHFIQATQSLASLYQAAGEILARQDKLDEAVVLLNEGIGKIPPTQSLFSLYQAAGEFLARQDKLDEAVVLLKEGIGKIPPTQNLFSLYQAAGEILVRQDKLDEAVVLLKEGIGKIPPTQSLASLYQAAGEILARQDKLDDAVVLLKEGIGKIPPTQSVASLYQAAGEILARQDKLAEAVVLLNEGIGKIPSTHSLFSLYQAAGEILVRQDKLDEAVVLLKVGIGKIPPTQNLFILYQVAGAVLSKQEKIDSAIDLLCEGVRKVPARASGYRIAESALLLAAASGRRELLRKVIAVCEDAQEVVGNILDKLLDDLCPEAASIAREARREFPGYFVLSMLEAFCQLGASAPQAAREAIASFSSDIREDKGSASTWLATFVALRCGETEEARRLFAVFRGKSVSDCPEPSERELLVEWNELRPFMAPHPSYYFPILPSALTGLPEPIVRPPSGAPVAELTALLEGPSSKGDGLTFLAVATEWSSHHGGLSTFNRELCKALAASGQRVLCWVPEATSEEIREAQTAGVLLLTAPTLPDTAPLAALSQWPPVSADFRPNFVIGHGRVTGPAAKTLVASFFPRAGRLHFVHMAPGEIEWFKEQEGASERAELRERQELDLMIGARLAVAIGPRLAREVGNLLSSRIEAPRLHRLDPGFAPGQGREPPPGIQILLLGRTEDLELKGIDIAAAAVARLPASAFESEPILALRGAPQGTGDALRAQLLSIAPMAGDRLRVREYTAEADDLLGDIRRSSLLLLPSRSEGFGLVALEALALGTPILVSDRSGIGELLGEQLEGFETARWIVQTTGDREKDSEVWSRAIEFALRDRQASFRRAHELRVRLASVLSWPRSIESFLSAVPGKVLE
jgi:glycosyltransferase involved in cell wall biosynthesis/tetratricopeptide (TPR) repeat protein